MSGEVDAGKGERNPLSSSRGTAGKKDTLVRWQNIPQLLGQFFKLIYLGGGGSSVLSPSSFHLSILVGDGWVWWLEHQPLFWATV